VKDKEESSSFLKKRTKKLLLVWSVLVAPVQAKMTKVFLVLFLQKKNCFLPSSQHRMKRLGGFRVGLSLVIVLGMLHVEHRGGF
jgi:hypothetical protein